VPSKMRAVRRALLSCTFAAACTTWASTAAAYRPFDGTDADVADAGDFDLELGPVHWYSQRDSHYLLAPATVLNLGLVHGWELVADFDNYVGIDQPPGEARVRLLDTDVFVKTVLVEGSVQDQGPGPSVATELGPLLPDVNGDEGFGASLDVIVSQHWRPLTLHLNNWVELSRGDLRPDWFEGIIVEGDQSKIWRPVSEWFVEHDFGAKATTVSGLVGAIWRAREGLDLDVGLREADVAGQRATEIRLGLTWTLGVWQTASEGGHASTGHRMLAWAGR
jgi:hypothetical protein